MAYMPPAEEMDPIIEQQELLLCDLDCILTLPCAQEALLFFYSPNSYSSFKTQVKEPSF